MGAERYEPFIDREVLQRVQREFGRLLDGEWLREGSGSPESWRRTGPRSGPTSGPTSAQDTAQSAWRPAADTRLFEDRFEVVIDLPGVTPEDVNVDVLDGVLRVRGTRSEPENCPQSGSSERRQGTFERRFDLPAATEESSIDASTKNGVLTIVVPIRQEPEDVYKVKVRADG